MTEEGYNGYTNFETWLICLNIDNDFGLYNSINVLVTDYLNETHEDRETIDKYKLGQIIKDWLEEIFFIEDCQVYKICDTWTFRDWQEIDWCEVAETRLME